jgi:hypothetical protein
LNSKIEHLEDKLENTSDQLKEKKKTITKLQRQLSNIQGENLEKLNLQRVIELEKQLEQALVKIRTRKVQKEVQRDCIGDSNRKRYRDCIGDPLVFVVVLSADSTTTKTIGSPIQSLYLFAFLTPSKEIDTLILILLIFDRMSVIMSRSSHLRTNPMIENVSFVCQLKRT